MSHPAYTRRASGRVSTTSSTRSTVFSSSAIGTSWDMESSFAVSENQARSSCDGPPDFINASARAGAQRPGRVRPSILGPLWPASGHSGQRPALGALRTDVLQLPERTQGALEELRLLPLPFQG